MRSYKELIEGTGEDCLGNIRSVERFKKSRFPFTASELFVDFILSGQENVKNSESEAIAARRAAAAAVAVADRLPLLFL